MITSFKNDDALLSIDSVFLGPPNWPLPFRARYSSYFVGLLVFLLVLLLERVAGVDLTFWSTVFGLLVTVGLTSGLMRLVNHDRPLRSILLTFATEVGGPRPPRAERELVAGRLYIHRP